MASFFESFNQRDFAEVAGLDVQFVQDNHSQAIRLPAELRLPDSVKRVDVRRAFSRLQSRLAMKF